MNVQMNLDTRQRPSGAAAMTRVASTCAIS